MGMPFARRLRSLGAQSDLARSQPELAGRPRRRLNRGPGLQVWLLVASLACTAFEGAAKEGTLQAGETTPDARRSLLVLELLFEGNLADSSAAKRTCAPRNAITFVEGRHGKCAAFDGRSLP